MQITKIRRLKEISNIFNEKSIRIQRYDNKDIVFCLKPVPTQNRHIKQPVPLDQTEDSIRKEVACIIAFKAVRSSNPNQSKILNRKEM